MNDEVPHIAIRVFYFCLLSFFAAVPTYIVVGFFVNVLSAGESFSYTGTIDFAGVGMVLGILVFSALISYVLWLLAWRTLKWSSGREDGGLLPPIIMKTAMAIFGSIGCGALFYGVYIGEFEKVTGGVMYILIALTAYKRHKNA